MDADVINQQLLSMYHNEESVNASCEGLLKSKIPPSGTQWYASLVEELNELQSLVKMWQTEEMTSLQKLVLPAIQSCADSFSQAEAAIENVFTACEKSYTDHQAGLVTALQQLSIPVNEVCSQVDSYEQKLKSWEQQFIQSHEKMTTTIGSIQSSANMLSSHIASVNRLVAGMAQELKEDKSTLARAKSKESGNVAKSILGIVVGVLTGGAGTILAGMGVASIAEGEAKIKELESKVKNFQKKISGYLVNMTQDQMQLVSLNVLTLPAQNILHDVETIESSVDDVRVSWSSFSQELEGVIDKISQAETASEIIVQKAWFKAACNEWKQVVSIKV